MSTSSRNRQIIRERRAGRPLAFALLAAFLAHAGLAKEPSAAEKLAQSVAEAQKLVEKVRGVPFRGSVASGLLPEKDLARVLEKKLVEDLPTTFDRYADSLSVIGFFEPDSELLKKITRLYTRQVAGFYDPAEKKFYIIPERSFGVSPAVPLTDVGLEAGSAGAAGLVEETLLAHELTHALQDRRLDIDRRVKTLKDSTDAMLALEAFLEGEATVVMTDALVERLPADARGLLGTDMLTQLMATMGSAGQGLEGAEGLPEFFVKELIFPYVAGATFIQHIKSRGGWAAVDEAYKRLPDTTSEILHPGFDAAPRARLGADRPETRDVPGNARHLYSDTFGEWMVRTLLERGGGEASAAASLAAERQDDRVVFFEAKDSKQIGFLWRLKMTSPAAAKKLSEALEALYASRAEAASGARPRVRAMGDVVEVVRGKKLSGPANEAGTAPRKAERR